MKHVTLGMRLFIYGTLKRGGCRSHFMQGQQYLGEARTVPKYRLYDCGDYPGLVCETNGVSVVGELWRIEMEHVEVLDAVEGVSENLFRRGRVELVHPFDLQDAWTYFYQQSVSGLRECGQQW